MDLSISDHTEKKVARLRKLLASQKQEYQTAKSMSELELMLDCSEIYQTVFIEIQISALIPQQKYSYSYQS